MSEKDLSAIKQAYDEFEVEWPMLVEELTSLMRTAGRLKDGEELEDLNTTNQVEDFYLSVLDGSTAVDVTENRLHRMILAYLGDMLIRNAAGQWDLDLDEEGTFYGCPRVIGWKGDDGTGFQPVGIRESLRRTRERGTFHSSLSWCINHDEEVAKLRREFAAFIPKRKRGQTTKE